MLFSLHKSMQNQSLPSLFQTRTTTKAHGLKEGLIAPTSCISWRCCLNSSCIDWGIRWYLLLNGHEFGSSLISCSTTKVSSKSRSCLEDTSANSANKFVAAWWSSRAQDLHPVPGWSNWGWELLVHHWLGMSWEPLHHWWWAQRSASSHPSEWWP